MYNRYIPQTDGTYQRRKMPDSISSPPASPQVPPPGKQSASSVPAPQPARRPAATSRPRPRPLREPEKDGSISTFLKQLLPRDLDTADLLVVLLILLMAGDCAEEQNTALLTLALYLFL